MNKLRTRLYYKQLKFNLLREESEGYAKTISELFAGDQYNDPLRTLARLQKLIGWFFVLFSLFFTFGIFQVNSTWIPTVLWTSSWIVLKQMQSEQTFIPVY